MRFGGLITLFHCSIPKDRKTTWHERSKDRKTTWHQRNSKKVCFCTYSRIFPSFNLSPYCYKTHSLKDARGTQDLLGQSFCGLGYRLLTTCCVFTLWVAMDGIGEAFKPQGYAQHMFSKRWFNQNKKILIKGERQRKVPIWHLTSSKSLSFKTWLTKKSTFLCQPRLQ